MKNVEKPHLLSFLDFARYSKKLNIPSAGYQETLYITGFASRIDGANGTNGFDYQDAVSHIISITSTLTGRAPFCKVTVQGIAYSSWHGEDLPYLCLILAEADRLGFPINVGEFK